MELVKSIKDDPYLSIDVAGFFDDRIEQRTQTHGLNHLGTLDRLADFVKKESVSLIYIGLPMTQQPRIVKLLDELNDTTASVYFVPDIFVFKLIQARFDELHGIPLIAVCETPFVSLNGVVKRASDIFLTSIILLMIMPIMIGIAIGVRFSSPGPILFKQRRYGLNGELILVYKFRTMTVMEDGSHIRQATVDDQRITKFGSFLRRTSLDELPQFFNVLRGEMSIVGPRPHAVAHNEMYRKLISSYMVRHKVKPGITGWAQVNGLRGETETVEKMQKRIECDLEYLQNWSLALDLLIIARTVLVLIKDKNAY
jgi:putative colanic acid biosynthesis UDP-glucose lipid carrier transferase